MTRSPRPSIIVLGGGIAGLTAAFRLTALDTQVTLVDGTNVDRASDPFIVSQSHRATHDLWRALHPQTPAPPIISLEFLLPDARTVPYPYTPLPQPIHVAASLLRFGGMTWRERFKLVSWLEKFWEGAIERPSDLAHRSADEWLASLGQSHHTRRTIWNPLAQWLTGAQLTTLPSDVLWATIEPIFFRSPREGRWGIAPSLHASLVQPIRDKLNTHGTMLRDTEAVQLLGEGDEVAGVMLRNGSIVRGDWYLAAVPHRRLTSLLPERWLSRYAYFQQLSELTDVSTMHLRTTIPHSCFQPRIVLLSDASFYTLIIQPSGPNSTICDFYGRTAQATDGSHSRTQLRSQAEAVLSSLHLLPADTTDKPCEMFNQEHNVLSLETGMQPRRPIQRSPIANLLLAGAWTDTGLPPNVESAVVSANRCVEIVTSSQR